MSMYKQLTQHQRYHIRLCLKAGYSLSGIARRLGFTSRLLAVRSSETGGTKAIALAKRMRKR